SRDSQNDELGWLEWRKANHDIYQPRIDIVLRRRSGIAFNKVGLLRSATLESAFAKEFLQKSSHVQPDLCPERFGLRLENYQLVSAINALFNKERESPYRNVFPLRCGRVSAFQRPCAPCDGACGEDSQAVYAERI